MMRLPESLFPHVSKEGTSAAEAVWGQVSPQETLRLEKCYLSSFPFPTLHYHRSLESPWLAHKCSPSRSSGLPSSRASVFWVSGFQNFLQGALTWKPEIPEVVEAAPSRAVFWPLDSGVIWYTGGEHNTHLGSGPWNHSTGSLDDSALAKEAHARGDLSLACPQWFSLNTSIKEH